MRNSKVVWSEGMFLQPHHFQQQERYFENVLEQRCSALSPYPWGFAELRLDEQLLALGKIAIAAARGVLPDGTPFSMPGDAEPPLPFDVPAETKNCVVNLALPLRREGMEEVDREDRAQSLARFAVQEYDAADSVAGVDTKATIQVGKLRTRLSLPQDTLSAYACLPVAKVAERRPDGSVLLSPEFIVPCLECRAAPRLSGFAREVLGLLQHRGQFLAEQVGGGYGGAAEIRDFLVLQVVNRFQPLFAHLTEMSGLHPESLYRTSVMLAGELATFTHRDSRSSAFPAYRHDDLDASFTPVMDDLRRSLRVVFERNAIPIPIEELKFGVRVADVPDRELLKSASFVLAVNAQMPAEMLRQRFPTQVTVGPAEKIKDLVKLALPGIALHPLPVAPRQVAFHAGYSYFELDSGSEYWKLLNESGRFAFFIRGEFPGIQLEFWAIRG
jgi:type VI secretion system protein ImpJ